MFGDHVCSIKESLFPIASKYLENDGTDFLSCVYVPTCMYLYMFTVYVCAITITSYRSKEQTGFVLDF